MKWTCREILVHSIRLVVNRLSRCPPSQNLAIMQSLVVLQNFVGLLVVLVPFPLKDPFGICGNWVPVIMM